MKQCPQCKRTYDDSQGFCLMDGTPLIDESEQPTIVKETPATVRKSNFLLWIGLTGLVILICGVTLVGLLIYKFRQPNDGALVKRQTNTSVSPAPAPKVSPTANPTQTTSPSPDASPAANANSKPPANTDNSDDADDITPIAWNTSAVAFKSDNGLTYKFRCPAGGEPSSIWGSDIYTQDSSVCTAAVHAGLFTLAEGGVVTVEFRPGRLTYGSTVRNGITSNSYGEYAHSFVVR